MNPVHVTYKLMRRITVAVIGLTVLVLGVVMVVMPGPAFIVIPVGLAILGLEFAWARVWLRKLRRRISFDNAEVRSNRSERHRERHMNR